LADEREATKEGQPLAAIEKGGKKNRGINRKPLKKGEDRANNQGEITGSNRGNDSTGEFPEGISKKHILKVGKGGGDGLGQVEFFRKRKTRSAKPETTGEGTRGEWNTKAGTNAYRENGTKTSRCLVIEGRKKWKSGAQVR